MKIRITFLGIIFLLPGCAATPAAPVSRTNPDPTACADISRDQKSADAAAKTYADAHAKATADHFMSRESGERSAQAAVNAAVADAQLYATKKACNGSTQR